MRKIITLFLILNYFLFAYEMGKITTANENSEYYKIGKELSFLFEQYDINLSVEQTNGSFTNLELLANDNSSTFGFVQKDVLQFYNFLHYQKTNESIFHKFPVLLSFGSEEIHIVSLERKEYNFDEQKNFKVYCGEASKSSCITARYIEKAYDFSFDYIEIDESEINEKFYNEEIDWIIKVGSAPIDMFLTMEDIKFIDLPTNFKIEDLYIHSNFTPTQYPFLNEDFHTFAVPRAIVTNITDRKYDSVLEAFIVIILKNREFLVERFGEKWNNIDFFYENFQKVSPVTLQLLKQFKE